MTLLLRLRFVLLALACACQSSQPSEPQTAAGPKPGDAFWNAVRPLCGQAFEGRVVEGTEPSDDTMRNELLKMHIRECSENQIRIPFHVGDNRSRTWVLTRSQEGVRLKHDHRHEDGSEDAITQYGGDAGQNDDGLSFNFPADDYTKNLIPAAATNIWTISITSDSTFTYALRREAANRRFRVDFDLTRPVPGLAGPMVGATSVDDIHAKQ